MSPMSNVPDCQSGSKEKQKEKPLTVKPDVLLMATLQTSAATLVI